VARSRSLDLDALARGAFRLEHAGLFLFLDVHGRRSRGLAQQGRRAEAAERLLEHAPHPSGTCSKDGHWTADPDARRRSGAMFVMCASLSAVVVST
jgi:hypothetical protein